MWHDDSNSEGTLLYASGDKYEGQLFNDKPHGKGVTRYKDESVYKGDYKFGDRNGFGTFT